ncbi:MAG: chemotaxis protein CheA [Gemmatimonas sp.]|nr:chemotaxis protein CheA [Gemmatimonas sp.]
MSAAPAAFRVRWRGELEQLDGMVLTAAANPAAEDTDDLLCLFHDLGCEADAAGDPGVAGRAREVENLLLDEGLSAGVDRILDATEWILHRLTEASATGPAAAPPGRAGVVDLRALEPETLGDFLGEADEHLSDAEASLMALERAPDATESLHAAFRSFHTLKGTAGFAGLEPVQELAHAAEHHLDRARRGEIVLAGDDLDLALAAADALRRLVAGVSEGLRGDGLLRVPPEVPALAARLAPPAAAGGLVMLAKGRERRCDAVAPASAPEPPPAPPPVATARAAQREAVRVSADRLDLLVDTIGELVITEAMIRRHSDLRGLPVEQQRNLERLGKLSRELQRIGLDVRMVPVRPVFQKMTRLVRDLARKSGRDVELRTGGEETELDRSVVDLLTDPLIHLLRNAVDHGIESDPAVRVAAGKPARAVIDLRAYHEGGSIVLEVADDGRGLDRDAILDKAVRRGLLPAGAQPADHEIHDLIFLPGFSTAAQITEVSGRGVGLDVVRRNLEELRGGMEIVSEPGRGCRFRFRLPLTLAVIDGLSLRTGAETYIVPTLAVRRIVMPGPDDVVRPFDAGELLRLDGELIPLLRLRDCFGVAGAPEPSRPVVLVVEGDGCRIGLVADELLGQQQVVIKGFDGPAGGAPGIAGGTILSDGSVALILDASGLVRAARARCERARAAPAEA